MQVITMKRGSTFVQDITRVEADGNMTPVDLTGLTITSQLDSKNNFTADLTVTVVNAAAGQLRISATAAQTETWPVTSVNGPATCDVRYVDGTTVIFSDTFEIRVVERITEPAA